MISGDCKSQEFGPPPNIYLVHSQYFNETSEKKIREKIKDMKMGQSV
jgi:hypothetical protein